MNIGAFQTGEDSKRFVKKKKGAELAVIII